MFSDCSQANAEEIIFVYLFKQAKVSPDPFNSSFNYLTLELIDFLSEEIEINQ